MLDKVSDFFSDIKDRLSSPFLSSFIIAWCLWNWEFVIAIFFYKQEDLALDGYISYIDLFNKTSTPCTKYVFPILVAFLYTFVYPAFKYLVLWAQAAYKKAGMKKVYEVSNTAHISVERYVKLKERYNKSLKDFADSVETDNEVEVINEDLRRQIIEAKDQYNSSQKVISTLKAHFDVKQLDGKWRLEIQEGLFPDLFTYRRIHYPTQTDQT